MRTRITSPSLVGAILASLALIGPALAEDVSLQDVAVAPGQTAQSAELIIQLPADAQGSAVSSFKMYNPDRLVIDIADVTVAPGSVTVSGSNTLITAIESETVSSDQGVTGRIRLSLAGAVDSQILTEGSKVRVKLVRVNFDDSDPIAASSGSGGVGDGGSDDFVATDADEDRPRSGPQQLEGGVTLTSLDYDQGTDTDRVVIGVKGTSAYRDTRPRSNTVIIDVPGAFVPQSLERVLDTSQFISPIRMVRAYRTSSGARVAITLSSDATYTVKTGTGGLLYIEVPVSAAMQRERQQAVQSHYSVSPSGGSSSSNQNAYRQGLLIGESGRTADPNSTFSGGQGALSGYSHVASADGFLYDSSSATSLPYTGRQLSLDFVNADIHSIFRLISSVARVNIIASDDVQGTVTVRMENVPWDQALSSILRAKGLASQRYGNIIRVAPIETIKTEQQMALEAKRAIDELEELQILTIPLNYATAGDIEEQIGTLLSPRGSMEIDERGNQLIIKDNQDTLAQIQMLVQQLDQRTPQVVIEARVVEASSNFTRGLGIQWGAEVDASAATGYSTGLFFPSSVGVSGALDRTGGEIFYERGQENLLVDLGPDGANSGIAFSLGSIPGLVNLDARLSALETDGYGKVVSSPKVTTLDNQTATISQGARIPFLSTSAGGTQVQFIQASLDLSVTPHITSDGKVFLSVQVSNNRADFSQVVQGNPSILIKEIATEVLVADGDTTVLGGVMATEESGNQDRVPLLSKIPLIGYLFKNSSESLTHNELLVFITPHIIERTAIPNSQ